jgi:trehalose 6-phosphate synthase/phosphatase
VKLKLKYFGQKVILTVDRLDPAKGLVERASAYQTLLRENPRLRGKVVLVMLVVPSRTDIKEYQQLKRRLERLIGDINAEFGTRRWQPVDYLPVALPFAQVTAYYRRADVAFIAPLRDGMNLVAKEYLASQPQRGGALILSQTAGAAEELKDAIVVNPRDPATLVTGLLKALTMPPRELQRRVGRMQRHLSRSNVHVWAGSFTKALKNEVRLPGSKRTVSLGISASTALRKAYRQANHRLLLLDYDGVLERFHTLPENAAPSDELSQLLTALGQHTQLVLISGRRKADLDAWFDGLPLTLVAEHGLHTKQPGDRWHTHRSVHVRGWYRTARQLMEKYAGRTPGAFVEQKDASLVWHYRDASPYYAQKHLVALKRGLKPLAAAHGLQIEQGNEILELRPAGVTKGSAAHELLQSRPDFILAMGDDYTDEDMFIALPTNAYTIKVGRGRTAARYRLNGVKDVLALLEKLQKID